MQLFKGLDSIGYWKLINQVFWKSVKRHVENRWSKDFKIGEPENLKKKKNWHKGLIAQGIAPDLCQPTAVNMVILEDAEYMVNKVT